MIKHNNTIKEKPIFTLITATYNADKFLLSTIESIKAQNFKSFEWIIVDSCSTDATQKIIQENTSIFDIIILEKDNGIYEAWNKGIKHSNGQWIAFIGAGDQLEENALEDYYNLIKLQKNGNEINFISSKAVIINANQFGHKIIGKEFIKSEFIKRMTISHVAAMHHRSLFDKFGLFSEEFKSSSDYEFLLRCQNLIRPLFLEKVTVKMLAGGISSSYKAIYETYLIHMKYHTKFMANIYFLIAVIKFYIKSKIIN